MKASIVFDIEPLLFGSRENLVISVPDYKFLSVWEPEIFADVCRTKPIAPFSYVPDTSSEVLVEAGYFRISPNISMDKLDSLSRFMSIRLFVCEPSEDFFCNIPSVVRDAVFFRGLELDEEVVLAASSMSSFKWMALRDGDEGDAYYYLFCGS